MPQWPEGRKQGGKAMAGRKLQAAVAALLNDFNRALAERDPALAGSFDKDAIFLGSEPGEVAHGRTAIAALLAGIFASPHTIRFDWTSVEADRHGETAWFSASGEVVILGAGSETRRVYTLTGVLVETKSGWRWRLFHGAEPWIAPAT